MITALEYFKIKNRMTNGCGIACPKCPLGTHKNGCGLFCDMLEEQYPKRAIEIVEQWGKEHPEKTYLSDFLEKYPKAKLRKDGTPMRICPSELGLKDIKDKNECYSGGCVSCWNQIIEEQ